MQLPGEISCSASSGNSTRIGAALGRQELGTRPRPKQLVVIYAPYLDLAQNMQLRTLARPTQFMLQRTSDCLIILVLTISSDYFPLQWVHSDSEALLFRLKALGRALIYGIYLPHSHPTPVFPPLCFTGWNT